MSTADESKHTPRVPELAATDAPYLSASTTPGATLRAARERKGLSLEQVAKETLLTSRYLKALEADEYDTLPGTTFVRGYLRRYAGLVGVSADAVVADFDAIWRQRNVASSPLIDAQIHSLQQEPLGSQRVNRRAGMFKRTARQFSLTKLLSLGSIALLLTLLVATVFWNDKAPVAPMTSVTVDLEMSEASPAPAVPAPDTIAVPTPVPETSDAAAPAPSVDAPADATAPGAATDGAVVANPAPLTPAPAVPVAVKPVAPVTPAATVPATTAVPAAATPRIDSLSFNFTGKSWISVRDATGQELVYGLKNAGQAVTVTGQPPFAINIGSVRDTQMSRNGVPVNLKPYTRGEIASFRLGR